MKSKYNSLFDEGQERRIAELTPTMTGAEMSEWILREYGKRVTTLQLRAWRKNHRIKCSWDGRYKPGNVSPNKGKPMPKAVYEKAKATMFKKGQKPWNDRFRVGDVRLVHWDSGRRKAYYEKVSDEGTLWERWKPRSYLNLERAGKPVPKDCCVLHIDGNSLNDDVANLMLVPKSAYGPMMCQGLNAPDRDALEAAIALIKVKSKLWSIEKKKERRKRRCRETR